MAVGTSTATRFAGGWVGTGRRRSNDPEDSSASMPQRREPRVDDSPAPASLTRTPHDSERAVGEPSRSRSRHGFK